MLSSYKTTLQDRNCARRVKVTRALNLCIMPCTVQKSCMIPSLQMVKSFGIFPKHHLYVRKLAISLLLDNIVVQFPPEEKSTLFQSPAFSDNKCVLAVTSQCAMKVKCVELQTKTQTQMFEQRNVSESFGSTEEKNITLKVRKYLG